MTIPAEEEADTDAALQQRPMVLLIYRRLKRRLDVVEFRIVKAGLFAEQELLDKDAVGAALNMLVAHGYLEAKPFDARTRLYRLVYARVKSGATGTSAR